MPKSFFGLAIVRPRTKIGMIQQTIPVARISARDFAAQFLDDQSHILDVARDSLNFHVFNYVLACGSSLNTTTRISNLFCFMRRLNREEGEKKTIRSLTTIFFFILFFAIAQRL